MINVVAVARLQLTVETLWWDGASDLKDGEQVCQSVTVPQEATPAVGGACGKKLKSDWVAPVKWHTLWLLAASECSVATSSLASYLHLLPVLIRTFGMFNCCFLIMENDGDAGKHIASSSSLVHLSFADAVV